MQQNKQKKGKQIKIKQEACKLNGKNLVLRWLRACHMTVCQCGLMPQAEARVSLLSDNCVKCFRHIKKKHVCHLC